MRRPVSFVRGGNAAARPETDPKPRGNAPSLGRLSGFRSFPARFTAVGLRHGSDACPPRAQSVRASGPGGLSWRQARLPRNAGLIQDDLVP